MSESVEKSVREFYDSQGWRRTSDGVLEDSRRWGCRLPAHGEYGLETVRRIATLYRDGGSIFLNCGSGPFTDGAVLCSENFERRVCVDISLSALRLCRERLQEHGLYLCGSMATLGLRSDIADGTLCEHALYHVDRTFQEATVREMIRVTKAARPIIIIYSNPLGPLNILEDIYRATGLNRLHGGGKLYFFRHRLKWWDRFSDECEVEIHPFNPISAQQARILLPHNAMARLFITWCKWLERRYPRLATHLWSYPLIVLRKKPTEPTGGG